MLELLFVFTVLVGQSSAFVFAINRFLLDADAGLLRAFALYVITPAVVLGAPVVVVGVMYFHGAIAGLLESPLTGRLATVYMLTVGAVSARWLWLSLITLPRRKSPPILAGCRSFDRTYDPFKRPGNPTPEPRSRNLLGSLNCRFRLEITEHALSIPELPPAFDGFSIVHLTDIHANRAATEGWLSHVAETACSLEPDLIALSGDFVLFKRDLPRVERFLRQLEAKHGVWAIRGNHDFWEVADSLPIVFDRCGIGFLNNHAVEISRGDESIRLIGVEPPWDHRPDWHDGLFPIPHGETAVVLTHSPDNGPRLADSGAALLLAGHHHGGQIRFPLVGSLVIPSRYGKRYDHGWFALGSLAMYVGRGIGNSMPAIRILCRPEIARFVLRRKRD